ncbi:MAG: helix-turn-helix domain-containing protein [Henriciella sp.]|nr:helix-turn-helix domain-containing protein [Henriciella sp.]
MSLSGSKSDHSSARVKLDQLHPILESAAGNGVDVDQILRDIGVSGGLTGVRPGDEIELIDYYRIQRRIGRILDDFTSNLSERRLTYRTGSFLVSTIQEARTLHAAVQSTCDHYNMLHGDEYNTYFVRDGLLHLRIDDATFPYRFRDDENLRLLVGDCLTIKAHCTLDSLTNGQAIKALRYVRLKRKRNVEDNPQNAYWNVPVKYGAAAYELVYDFDEACVTIPRPADADLSADGILTRVISYLKARSDQIDERSYHARVFDLMLSANVSQSSIAKELGVSVATLRRRLSEEGYTFRDLRTQMTLEKADRLLGRGQSISQVSEALNYSDIRSFIRAYKKQKGQTPSAFVRAQRALEEDTA